MMNAAQAEIAGFSPVFQPRPGPPPSAAVALANAKIAA